MPCWKWNGAELRIRCFEGKPQRWDLGLLVASAQDFEEKRCYLLNLLELLRVLRIWRVPGNHTSLLSFQDEQSWSSITSTRSRLQPVGRIGRLCEDNKATSQEDFVRLRVDAWLSQSTGSWNLVPKARILAMNYVVLVYLLG
jgi:hypothetical protein